MTPPYKQYMRVPLPEPDTTYRRAGQARAVHYPQTLFVLHVVHDRWTFISKPMSYLPCLRVIKMMTTTRQHTTPMMV